MVTKRFSLLAALLCAFAMLRPMHSAAAPKTPVAPTPQKLSVICSVQKEWCELLSARYQEEFAVQVDIRQMATNAALEQIRNSPEGSRFDVWFGGTGDPHLEAANENLTLPYRSPHYGKLHDWATRQATLSDNRTVGIYAGMLGFIVNVDELGKRGLRAPRCWFNLLRPEYAGKVLSTNPQTSGTAYTMISTLTSMMGEEQAFQYMTQLNASIAEYTASGSSLAKRVAQGEFPIAIGFIHDGIREKLNGAPVAVVPPCEGTGYETGSVSIIKGGNVAEAKRFVDWVLSPKTQKLAAEVRQYQIPSNKAAPIPTGSVRFDELKIYQAYNPKKFSDPGEKARLLARWKNEVLDQWKSPR